MGRTWVKYGRHEKEEDKQIKAKQNALSILMKVIDATYPMYDELQVEIAQLREALGDEGDNGEEAGLGGGKSEE